MPDIANISHDMKNVTLLVCIVLFTLPACFTSCHSDELTWHASGKGGVVAAGPKPSVQTGIDILAGGGNAVDGAVAAIFNLAVSDYGSFCIGGEVPFMLYKKSEGKIKVFNGMGGAPGDKDAIAWCYANGIPRSGIRSSTVPSAVSTLLKALETEGTMSFEKVIMPTLALLDKGGQEWYPRLAETLRRMVATELIGDPIMIFLDQATGISYAAGEPRYARGKFCGAVDNQ
jgi:gamma-glutamyltranspeptidase/glutathione hydrolase